MAKNIRATVMGHHCFGAWLVTCFPPILSLGHNPPCTSLRRVCVGFGSQNADNRTADAFRRCVFWDGEARSGYWTVCINCCVRCVFCGNVADTCVQRTAVHLRRALPVRFGRPANANLMPAGTSTAVPPTCVPATDVRVTQRTQPPHTCSAVNVRVTHLAGTASVLSVGII